MVDDGAQLIELVEATEPDVPVHDGGFVPFPIDSTPALFRQIVMAASEAIGCDPVMIALPGLTAAAGSIGLTRRVFLKRSYHETSILFSAIVGESGTLKTPALSFALAPIFRRQRTAATEWQQRLEVFEEEMARWEKDRLEWKSRKGKGDAPRKPEEPVLTRYYVADSTVEALAVIANQNPRGPLMASDELSGLLKSFNAYRGGLGRDRAFWLEAFQGNSFVVDRKGGRPVFIPRLGFSIIGGVQPKILKACLDEESVESGLAARFLLAWPPPRPVTWSEADVEQEHVMAWDGILERLYELEFDRDDDGDFSPVFLALTPDARELWADWVNQVGRETVRLTGLLAGSWAKIRGYAARLALVIHLIRWASGESVSTRAIDAESMASGITLARWFGEESTRIYGVLGMAKDPEEHTAARLLEWLRTHNKLVTVRDIQRTGRFGNSKRIESMVEDLIRDGFGRWVAPERKGPGRPAMLFELIER